jgi:hypothetical protein
MPTKIHGRSYKKRRKCRNSRSTVGNLRLLEATAKLRAVNVVHTNLACLLVFCVGVSDLKMA